MAIRYSVDEKVNRDWSSDAYANKEFLLWIYDEDDVTKTQEWLDAFLQNPQSAEFSESTSKESLPESSFTKYTVKPTPSGIEVKKPKEQAPPALFSTVILLITSIIFLFDMAGERALDSAPSQVQKMLITSSPIKRTFLYDYPEKYALADKIVSLYGYEALAKPQDLEAPGQFLYAEYMKTPQWIGVYPYILYKAMVLLDKEKEIFPPVSPPPEIQTKTLFEKAREGEVWRFFTPALLHNDILHIFFNMIWLLLLCPQMEVRMGGVKLVIFMLIAALFSNTAQYLMSGPHFIGFSGIICAMVFFMRRRQSKAPWEGYLLTRSTFTFICFFIGVLALLSFFSFMLQLFYNSHLQIGIANTAHLSGAFIGYVLGSINFFRES